MSDKGELLQKGQGIFKAREDKALPFGFFRGSVSLPFFPWGMDSQVEVERREGDLSIAEPPIPKKSSPCKKGKSLGSREDEKVSAYFNRSVIKYSKGDVKELLEKKLNCAGPLLQVLVNGIEG